MTTNTYTKPSLRIGLDSTNIHSNCHFAYIKFNKPHLLYHYNGDRMIWVIHWNQGIISFQFIQQKSLKCNDVIKLKVNTKNNKFIFYKNDVMIDQPITFIGYKNNNYNFVISSISIQLIESIPK